MSLAENIINIHYYVHYYEPKSVTILYVLFFIIHSLASDWIIYTKDHLILSGQNLIFELL